MTESARPHDHQHAHAAGSGERDPVCGMSVDPATAKHKAEHAGRTYHFCSERCLTRFEANPGQFLDKAAAPPPSAPAGTIYTCPMHPQIRQEGPGPCPICGMALEPETIAAEAPPNPELADMRRRFWVGLVLAVPVIVLEMGGHLFGLGHLIAPRLSAWIQFAFATPVVLWAGAPFFTKAWTSILRRKLNMFTLIGMGVTAAYGDRHSQS